MTKVSGNNKHGCGLSSNTAERLANHIRPHHLGRMEANQPLFFHIKGVADVPANNALKRTLLFYSLGNAGDQKAYHLSPDQRPAEETYANYLAELGKV